MLSTCPTYLTRFTPVLAMRVTPGGKEGIPGASPFLKAVEAHFVRTFPEKSVTTPVRGSKGVPEGRPGGPRSIAERAIQAKASKWEAQQSKGSLTIGLLNASALS
jgi:hypothetical protein